MLGARRPAVRATGTRTPPRSSERYAGQDPAAVGAELVEAAEVVAAQYDELVGAASRPGSAAACAATAACSPSRASAATTCTTWSTTLHDVRGSAARADGGGVRRHAAAYGDGRRRARDAVRQPSWTGSPATVGAGARVLEIGSGRRPRRAGARGAPGCGSVVPTSRRAFVELLRSAGLRRRPARPAHRRRSTPRPAAYDGVWASACLLHVARDRPAGVLSRLADATRPGGRSRPVAQGGRRRRLVAHGHVEGPRRFVYWREEPLRAALDGAGWRVDRCSRLARAVTGEEWIVTRAGRF